MLPAGGYASGEGHTDAAVDRMAAVASAMHTDFPPQIHVGTTDGYVPTSNDIVTSER